MKRFLIHATLLFILLTAWGCGNLDKVSAPEMKTTRGTYTSAEDVMSIIKAYKGDTASEASGILMAPSSGTWSESKYFDKDYEDDIELEVPGVVEEIDFEVDAGSLSEDTTITMTLYLEVNQDELGSLRFEFGPSGTEFHPEAELEIPFELLLTDDVDTFVITCESGDEIEGISYDIDYDDEELEVYIPHFSEYYFNRR